MTSNQTLLKLQQAEDLLQEERWEKALALLKGLTPPSNPDLSASLYFCRAEACRLGGRYAEALSAYERSVPLYKKTQDNTGLCSALLGAAGCLRHIENFSKANLYYQEVIDLSESHIRPHPRPLSLKGEGGLGTLPSFSLQGEGPRMRADALCGLGLSLKGQGKLREAREKLEESLKLYTRLKDQEGTAHNQWALGVIHRTAGRLAEAREALTTAAMAYERLGDSGGLAYTQCALGGAERLSGEPEVSFQLYRKAQAAFKKLHDPYGIAYGFCGMASAERVRGKTAKALALYQEAEKLYRQLNQRTPLAFTHWGQAGAKRIKGSLPAAVSLYKKSKTIFQSVRDERGELYADLGLAYCQLDANQIEDAQNSFKQIFSRAETLGLPLEACHAQRGLLRCLPDRSGFLKHALTDRYRALGVSPNSLLHTYQDVP